MSTPKPGKSVKVGRSQPKGGKPGGRPAPRPTPRPSPRIRHL